MCPAQMTGGHASWARTGLALSVWEQAREPGLLISATLLFQRAVRVLVKGRSHALLPHAGCRCGGPSNALVQHNLHQTEGACGTQNAPDSAVLDSCCSFQGQCSHKHTTAPPSPSPAQKLRRCTKGSVAPTLPDSNAAHCLAEQNAAKLEPTPQHTF